MSEIDDSKLHDVSLRDEPNTTSEKPQTAAPAAMSPAHLHVGRDMPDESAIASETNLPSVETTSSEDAPVSSGPPPLPYTLRTKKLKIMSFWGLVFIDCVLVPCGLYFGLWYGTDLSHNMVFTISTAALGGVSVFEYFLRFWRLWRKDSNCRPIGSRRKYLDWFHIIFSGMWFIIAIELIVGTVFTEPLIRLLAMPIPSLMFWFGTELLFFDAMRILGYRAPIRFSSIPQGAPLRPGIYSIIEDVVAVDGNGGTKYREALNARYEASHYFRQMLHRLTLFWSIGALVMTAAVTAIVFTTDRPVAYTLGWTLPFPWAGIWTYITIRWVQRDLKHEKEMWGKDRRTTSASMRARPQLMEAA